MEGEGAECHAAAQGHELPVSVLSGSPQPALQDRDTHGLFNNTKHGSFLPAKV